jgi:hypothetical protein
MFALILSRTTDARLTDEGHMLMNAIPFNERLSCTVDEACVATGLGRTKLYEEIAAGRVHIRKVGKRTLVIVDSLHRMLGIADESNDSPALPV